MGKDKKGKNGKDGKDARVFPTPHECMARWARENITEVLSDMDDAEYLQLIAWLAEMGTADDAPAMELAKLGILDILAPIGRSG